MGDAYWATQNKTESQRTRCLWSRGQDDTYGCSQDEGVLAIGSKPRVLQLETVDSPLLTQAQNQRSRLKHFWCNLTQGQVLKKLGKQTIPSTSSKALSIITT